MAEKPFLNIGCGNDPFNYGSAAIHVDLDIWKEGIPNFVRADAHALPFPDKSFHTVLMGDIVEHLYSPEVGIAEAARVSKYRLVMTIFEEQRLKKQGLQIKAGQALHDSLYQAEGFKNYIEGIQHYYPEYEGVDDRAVPHIAHINHFTQADIERLVDLPGFVVEESLKEQELEWEGQWCYNWLVSLRRVN